MTSQPPAGIGEAGLDADDPELADEWRVGLDDAVIGERDRRKRDDLVNDGFVRHEVDGQDRLVSGGRAVAGGDAGQVDVVGAKQSQ